jgi:phosphoadenosine phosphosulfate reductase
VPAPDSSAQKRDDDAIDRHNVHIIKLLKDIDFESMEADKTLEWAAESIGAGRVVLNTSLQMAGVAMIHMATNAGLGIRIATLDTLRLPPETYSFLHEIEERYGINIEVCTPDAEKVDRMVRRFGEFLFFDGKHLQDHCCKVRKTDPNNELLKTADCWISGLRRDQSTLREQTPKATSVTEHGSKRRILKLNPMADWTQERLQSYVDEHDIPQHPLYAQGYQSIGCVICSTPTLSGEDARAGRWRWFNNSDELSAEDAKECGLHIPMYNI